MNHFQNVFTRDRFSLHFENLSVIKALLFLESLESKEDDAVPEVYDVLALEAVTRCKIKMLCSHL